jgi:hypothetical protein
MSHSQPKRYPLCGLFSVSPSFPFLATTLSHSRRGKKLAELPRSISDSRQHRSRQRTVNGRVQWCYLGVGMASADEDRLNGVNDINGISPLFKPRRESENGSAEAGGESVKQDRRNPVNPVNPVNQGGQCTHPDVAETPTHDGYVNRQCKLCGAWLPCRKAEQSA